MKDPGENVAKTAFSIKEKSIDLSQVDYDKYVETKGKAETVIDISALIKPVKAVNPKRLVPAKEFGKKEKEEIRQVKLKRRKNLQMMKARVETYS